jgi:hypothetical protein
MPPGDGVAVTPSDLVTHAAHVDSVADVVDTAKQAGDTVRLALLAECRALRRSEAGYSSAVGSLSRARLDALVEEATVDCYNGDEQPTGLYTR